MNFAINYSTQAAVLCEQGRLPVDRFKCPDWPDLIEEAKALRPVAVHFNIQAGRGKLRKKDLERIYRIADQTQTPYINLHLEAKAGDYPQIPLDSNQPEHRALILDGALSDVGMVVERFGNERVILENIPYRKQGRALRMCVEPELINRVIRETGCGFLFDIPHARISAHYLGIDELDYIQSLPCDRIRELHFTGVQRLGDWLQDHLPAQESDWSLLDWVLERIRSSEWPKPWLLAFEYGGVGERFSWRSSALEIEQQGQRLYSKINAI